MIASVQGNLLKKKPEGLIISVLGIGLHVEIPLSTFYDLPEEGETVFLHTYMLVREDAIRLFGFRSEAELNMFKLLIDISRIGPKLALTILSGITPAELHKAALQKDHRMLSAIPGIGKKSADRILFEIGEKLDKISAIRDLQMEKSTVEGHPDAVEIVAIMVNLGYRQKDAEKAVEDVIRDTEGRLTVDDMIRAALKKLAGR